MAPNTTDLRPPHLRPEAPAVPQQEGQGPFIDPRLDPGAAAYAHRIAMRKQANMLPKGGQPLIGGGPGIPRLDAPHQQGLTMAQQAQQQQHPQPEQPMGPGIVETPLDPRLQGPPQQQHPNGSQLRLMPGDMLPEEALRDPQALTGPGSSQAAAQPYLAGKYGVMRGGQRIPPQALVQQGKERTLSPETLAGMRAITEAQQAQAVPPPEQEPPSGMPQTEEQALQTFDDSPAAASQKAGEPDNIQKAVNEMDSFDYSQMRDRTIQDMLNHPEQRKIVEDRLKELEIDDLIMKNRVSQDVPIIPVTAKSRGFVIRYTSMSGEEELALKRLVMEEASSVEVTERYLLDKFSFMSLTCGLTAINGNAAPTHLDQNGNFDEKLFWKKFEWVMKRPVHMLSSIGVHHTYFEMRVRRLFVAEKLGNG